MLPLVGARPLFNFTLEPDLRLLTATRTGSWPLAMVTAYQAALRLELVKLQSGGRPTAFIIDIRSSGAQAKEVADALRSMVAGLGELHADRTAVVTSSGLAKLQARRAADPNAQVFTSMVHARAWATAGADPTTQSVVVHDEPSTVEAEGLAVHLHGPSDVDIALTAAAALETARRLSDAAVEVLLEAAAAPPETDGATADAATGTLNAEARILACL